MSETIFTTAMSACHMYANNHILAILGSHADISEITPIYQKHYFRLSSLLYAEQDFKKFNINVDLQDVGRETEIESRDGWLMFDNNSQDEIMLLYLIQILTAAYKAGEEGIDITQLTF